ncbi:hypothetical protein MMC30_001012 [Trapelia coarctata]|nr:hypothetical protein [Trapelia coarctata]
MTATLTNGDMPLEKQKRAPNGVATSSPTLAARNGKPLSIAPRLAAASSPRLPPRLAKDSRPEALQTPKANARDESVTPAKPFLSSNITPRSGLRKARVDSASSTPNRTPNGTPGNSRPTSIVVPSEKNSDENRGSNGLGLRGVTTESPGAPVSNGKTSAAPYRGHSPQRTMHESPEISPMFFHASDFQKGLPSKITPQRNQLHTKSRSVVSIGGNEDLGTDGSWSYTTSPMEESQPKFFYANGAPETKSNMIQARSTASNRPSPKQTTFSPQSRGSLQRAPSPLKEVEVSDRRTSATSTSRRRISSTSNAVLKPTDGLPVTSPAHPNDISRRSSLRSATVPQVRHAKASSVSSIDSRSNRKSNSAPGVNPVVISSSSASITASPSPLVESLSKPHHPTATMNSIPLSPSIPSQNPQPLPQSPSRAIPADSKLEQLNTLAANARRERKVLDLEISNSSLLVINRTLEREMRKQKSELRRYRRLTSTGRISIAPSNFSISTRFSGLTGTDASSDLDLDLDMDMQDEDLEAFSDGEGSSVSHSPTSPHARSARQRAKDEKRMQLDLSKHQELLLDSQRMNQSLKRCLGWTEDLIKEGERALAYQAMAHDEDIRGRVLTPEEVDGEVERGRGLLSPALDTTEDPWDKLGRVDDTEAVGELD